MINATGIDPRTDLRGEVWPAGYRVYFWEELGEHGPGSPSVWSAHELDLSGTDDVVEVLNWANADGRRYTLYVCVDIGEERALVQLHGVDPTSPETGGPPR